MSTEAIEMAQALGVPILPVRIREGVTVAIYGLPADLTKAEAEKIARIVMAYGDTTP